MEPLFFLRPSYIVSITLRVFTFSVPLIFFQTLPQSVLPRICFPSTVPPSSPVLTNCWERISTRRRSNILGSQFSDAGGSGEKVFLRHRQSRENDGVKYELDELDNFKNGWSLFLSLSRGNRKKKPSSLGSVDDRETCKTGEKSLWTFYIKCRRRRRIQKENRKKNGKGRKFLDLSLSLSIVATTYYFK